MLLFSKFNMYSCVLILLIFNVFSIFLTKFSFNLCTLDLLTRSSLNMFIVNNLYFFWTSLWYLYLFFFTIIFCYIFINFSKVPLLYFIFSMLFIIFNYILYMESFYNNCLTGNVTLNGEHINILLKNSVNKIHPFLLYSSSSIFFITTHMFFFSKKFKVFCSNSFYTALTVSRLKNDSLYILIALYMGSWWALQEGSWGGWWNWDPSEFFGVIILFFILSFFHLKLNLKCNRWLYYFGFSSLSYLFIFFLLLQLNFSIISHNFGFRSVKFINIEILLLCLLSFCTCYYFTYYKIIHTSLFTFLKKTSAVFNFSFILRLILLAFNFVVLVLLTSFFLKIILNFKFFLSFLSFSKLLLITFICFYVRFFYVTMHLSFLFLNGFLYDYLTVFYLSTFYNYSTKYLFHYLVFLTMVLNIFYRYSVLNDYMYVDFSVLKNHCSSIALNSRELELLLNFITSSSTFESKSFELTTFNNYIYQIYLISNSWWYFAVTTIDNVPAVLNTLLFILMTFLLRQYSHKPHFNK